MNSFSPNSTTKRAILYTRVSTDEQADKGYSLRAQEERLRHYCELQNLTVIQHFQDDASAKTFDRPEFKRLLELIRRKQDNVNTLLVVKWDRFSRNATDAYAMIRELLKLGVMVHAVEQPVDITVPEQKIMLAIYLATPEVENDRRSLNVSAGMRRALKEGRWVCGAPKGYKMGRDSKDKPLLFQNEKAVFIREAFTEMATGQYGMEEVRARLRAKGFECSKNQFTLLLRNPIYEGVVRVPAFGDEPERFVRGLHEPIVSESIYEKVHAVLDGRTGNHRGRPANQIEDLPLRGHLLCRKCGGNLTGSASRGHGGKYFYYHCQHGCDERINATLANKTFEKYLDSIRVAPEVVKLYTAILEDVHKSKTEQGKSDRAAIDRELYQLEERLLSVDEKFVEGSIDSDSYKRLKAKYELAGRHLRNRRNALGDVDTNFMTYVRYGFSLVSRLPECYSGAPLEIKRKLIGSIFPEKLILENGEYRTTRLNEVVRLLQGKTGELGEMRKDWHAATAPSPITWTQQDSNL